jgi:hypothetical protein
VKIKHLQTESRNCGVRIAPAVAKALAGKDCGWPQFQIRNPQSAVRN